jgi:hypothetical protein
MKNPIQSINSQQSQPCRPAHFPKATNPSLHGFTAPNQKTKPKQTTTNTISPPNPSTSSSAFNHSSITTNSTKSPLLTQTTASTNSDHQFIAAPMRPTISKLPQVHHLITEPSPSHLGRPPICLTFSTRIISLPQSQPPLPSPQHHLTTQSIITHHQFQITMAAPNPPFTTP